MLPGANREDLVQVLDDLTSRLDSLRGGSGGPDRFGDYLGWTTIAARTLRGHVAATEIDRLVYSGHYDRLLLRRSDDSASRDLLSLELDHRHETFSAEKTSLRSVIERWSSQDLFVGFDTTFFINYPSKIADVDFQALFNVRDDTIHLLIPLIVVDELDKLKDSKDRLTRWRAAHTLGYFDEKFQYPTHVARLRDEDYSQLKDGGIPRGTVTAEILFDPPGHVRLPIEDDEIIDRLITVQPLVGRKVRFITYDTGQSMRARKAGLEVRKLSKPREEEPAAAAPASPKPARRGNSGVVAGD